MGGSAGNICVESERGTSPAARYLVFVGGGGFAMSTICAQSSGHSSWPARFPGRSALVLLGVLLALASCGPSQAPLASQLLGADCAPYSSLGYPGLRCLPSGPGAALRLHCRPPDDRTWWQREPRADDALAQHRHGMPIGHALPLRWAAAPSVLSPLPLMTRAA